MANAHWYSKILSRWIWQPSQHSGLPQGTTYPCRSPPENSLLGSERRWQFTSASLRQMLMTTSALENVADREENSADSATPSTTISTRNSSFVVTQPEIFRPPHLQTPSRNLTMVSQKLSESKLENLFKRKVDTILVMGDKGSGKTTFINTYVENNSKLAAEVQFVEVPAHDISKITRKLCRKTAAAVVICDVNSKSSIAAAGRWKTALDKSTSFYRPVPSIFVGNKVDLLTDIERGMAIGAEAQRLGTKHGFNRWFVTEAAVAKNVKNAMEELLIVMAKSNRQSFDYVVASLAKSKRQEEVVTKISDEEIDEIKEGSAFIKYGRNGKPKLRILWINEDGTRLCWGLIKGKASNSFSLSTINGIITGQRTPSFRKCAKKEHRADRNVRRSFSLLISGNIERKSIDLMATSDKIYEVWNKFFQVVIAHKEIRFRNGAARICSTQPRDSRTII
eukprot:jgi/Bigna1/89496/estExt_fgenesh1_pg.C_500067